MRTGGIETSLVNLLSMLDKDKYNIDLVLFYPDGELLQFLPDWINIIPIWKIKNKKSSLLKRIVLSRNIFFRIIKNIIFHPYNAKHFVPKKHYDFAIAYSGYFNFMDILAGISNSTKKLVWVQADFYTQYNIDSNFKRKFKSIYKKYKYFDKIICVSEKASENFKILCPELSNKVTFNWNINKERTSAIIDESSIKLSSNYNIITIARLDKYKGIERLITVSKLLKDANIDFKMYVLGDGPYKEKLLSMINELDVNEQIVLLGNVNNVFSVIKQADLYVSPSDCEGLSNVTLESLLCNVPVVATPTAGSIDIFNKIAPTNSMLLAENFSTEELYNKILLAINGKVTKDFKLDINKLNKQILDKFEKNILL